MGKHKLRQDKTCLNCSYVVENRFCPNCGQENIETKKTFHHLIFHFFEDLTHYENAFWKTIRNLILKPSSLTREYLSGKRMSYLAPVRLYIFISFVTFFLISVLPGNEDLIKSKFQKGNVKTGKEYVAIDSLKKNDFNAFGYKSVQELDSLERIAKPSQRMDAAEYWLTKKATQVAEKHYTKHELKEKFLESFFHNLPKVLFIYMPIFAFMLWLFHNKKKWYYFDHGIFTLHYFSFLLLGQLTISLIESFLGMFGLIVSAIVGGTLKFAILVYMFYYFFPAHHRFYGGTRFKTILKGSLLFFINMFFISLILVLYVIYIFLNIH